MDRASRDAQVFEFCADRRKAAFFIVRRMLGVEPGDDAIGGDHIHYVEPFQRRHDQRVIAAIVGLKRAGDVRDSLLERDKFSKLKIFHARTAVASDDGKRAWRLNIDGGLERPREMAAESMG